MFRTDRSICRSRVGFTLVELMISIAIVLLLVGGINLIFSTTSKAVGSGQALSEGARNNQAAQVVMFHDFSAAVTDDTAPFMVIYNHAIPAFRTLADQQGDRDYDPTVTDPVARRSKILTIDNDNDNQEGVSAGETIDPTDYNDRNHRTDIIEFFCRDLFKRQTGNDGTYVANQSSNEAMIWYGHLTQPDNNGVYSAASSPGNGTFNGASNPNNFFATQWILGRQAILLTKGSAGVINADGANQYHLDPYAVERDWNGSSQITTLAPLQYNSSTYNGTAPDGTVTAQSSRYDLADTTLLDFRNRLKNYLDPTINPTHQSGSLSQWWMFLNCNDAYRFNANPFVTKPVSSAEFAHTAPIFLSGCSQFIVEFAGDYIHQDPATGALVAPAGPDSTLDFFVAADGSHQVQWYGMPRNTVTTGETIASGPSIRAVNGDVVPVFAIAGAQTFEHQTGVGAGPEFVGTVQPNAEYVCAWGPSDADKRPWMIRITYSLDDPASRLGNPLTYEYVFKIK